jgi:hypothetical protein
VQSASTLYWAHGSVVLSAVSTDGVFKWAHQFAGYSYLFGMSSIAAGAAGEILVGGQFAVTQTAFVLEGMEPTWQRSMATESRAGPSVSAVGHHGRSRTQHGDQGRLRIGYQLASRRIRRRRSPSQ